MVYVETGIRNQDSDTHINKKEIDAGGFRYLGGQYNENLPIR